jgi:endonuclease/exonuclease/phosphatase family metal-dependent hydrolase
MVTSIPPLTADEQIEFGYLDKGQSWPADRKTLVVASYNIRYARGPFLISGGLLRKVKLLSNRRRSETVSRNIKLAAGALTAGKLMPPIDVLALQEADKQTARAGGVHVARELATELNMPWVHAPAGIPRGIKPVQREWWLDFEEPIELHDKGDTGIALISRHPLSDLARIDLPWQKCPWRPRLAMGATVPLRNKGLRIINVHVDPHAASDGQLQQLEVLAKHADATTGPIIIVGDFNTLSKQKCLDTRLFLEARGYTTPFTTGTATWRGSGIRLHADWIFTRDVEVKNWGVARPLSSSDHWPVWVEIEVSDTR